ncbi:MAG TPA: hypothetical protein VGM67_06105 [Gemmatimonadaceae bacterium]|jgi:hypothetical protein
MNILYHAHSGLRYLVILAALGALVALGYGLATGRNVKRAFTLAAVFTGVLDLQIVLGIGLVVGGIFPEIVVGHFVMMVVAAGVTHGSGIIGRRSATERRELIVRLCGVTLALLIIAGGIMALGRGALTSAPMTPR